MTAKILIGTSGWGYDEWIGPFYPKSLKKEDFLFYYSEIYYTNEINTTFYNTPSRWIVQNWASKTPNNFLFSVKIPQTITHEHKLNIDACLKDLIYFLDSMKPLREAGKLLSFLIQLPPTFKKDVHFGNLKEFINNWPGYPDRVDYNLVIEFRNKSWMNEETFEFLREKGLTYCAVIEPLLPPRMDITNSKLMYIRFHGFGEKIWFDYNFKEEEIKKWAESIRDVIPKVEKIGIYFNNHFSGYAAKNSLTLMQELGIQPRNAPDRINILDIKKKTGEYSKGQTDLDKFLK
jgi:uncharacterized protein YecE (DUF72 family)